jgi:S-adenosylmethionine decarboxylase
MFHRSLAPYNKSLLISKTTTFLKQTTPVHTHTSSNPTQIESWGLHLTIDGSNCNPKSIRSKSTIEKFTRDLVQKIDMKAFGEPQIVMFGDANKRGFTLVQLIETSNICAHFCEENNSMYFDLFSCKYFEKEAVEKLVYNYFQPAKIKTHVRKRDAESLV